ncbi:S1 family peptidase [Amycolatopsis decaplanina]|uniref:Peptidase S1 and S6 chymotrypsin/Hap n=1 Tax=Amycolatopsis decaplanina DSM 44594 TaxID=1284240 RepID=M2YTJ9_9PSEU|nr:trypsin-like serine protease [Amycolatopsis decaplanina]EME51659.1 peptidase S1 and S6 chymotrypsin/Hap [Amycolatopsis decaplanina DSM 44594]
MLFGRFRVFASLAVVCAVALAMVPSGYAGAIVGGDAVPPGAYPWLVRFGNPGEGYCSGSLVSRRHIVTAAHCVSKNPDEPDDMYAYFLTETRPYTVRVVRTERHPWGVGDARNIDVAVLTLERRVRTTPVRLVPSGAMGPILPGSPLTVAGYGMTEHQRPERAHELTFTATYRCDQPGPQWFCADAPRPGTGVRPEDSGAPAFTRVGGGRERYMLVGTVSNHRDHHTWFANLAQPPVNDWIRFKIFGDFDAGQVDREPAAS